MSWQRRLDLRFIGWCLSAASMPADFSPEIRVVWDQRNWAVIDTDGAQMRFAYRKDALAKARFFRLAARSRGVFPIIVIVEKSGEQTQLLR